jgi:hypothetical protein
MDLLPFLFCTTLIFLSACGQQNSLNENFYFHPDSSKLYTVTLNTQETSSWQYGKEQTMKNSAKITMVVNLARIIDSVYEMKLTFGDIRISQPPVTITNNGVTKTYQLDSIPSKKGIKNNFLQLGYYWLGLTKGLSEYVWMNKKGEVLKVAGFDSVVDSIAVLSGSDKKEVNYSLRERVGEKIIADYFNQLFCIAPDHKENRGESWVRTIILINKAPVKFSNMYLVDRMEGDSIFLVAASSISGWAGLKATTPFMEGSGDGQITISRSSGIPYSLRLHAQTKTKTDSYDITSSEIVSATIR